MMEDMTMATVIRGGRVITVGDLGVIQQGVVVVDGSRITAVGPEKEVAVPKGTAQEIDVKGRTILPGMIDMHTHVCPFTDAETREGINARTVTESVVRAIENLRRTTAAGITTVRDMGCKHAGIFALRRAIDAGERVGPRILPCGAAIAMTGGHGYNSVADEADGPEACRALARQQLRLGADVIKIMASGGAGTWGERVVDSQLTVAEIAAAVEEAHKKGKTAAAHATYIDSVLDSLSAGIDTIEHGLILNDACIQKMLKLKRYYVPTLEAYERIVRLGEKVYPPYFVPKAEMVVGPHKESFQLALKTGVKMAAGTDSGGHFWPMGDMALELERMVEFGMAPMAALEAATRNAADAIQRLDQFGTLEPGKLADLIVVDGNPLDDMTAMRNVWMVMREGKVQVGGA
jgi:imidazolonepropionase-like amidohydrolase